MKHLFNVPKPKSYYNHYSNPQSQGALLCETVGFPESFDDEIQEVFDAYTDRMAGWDYENYQKACKIFNGSSMQNATDEQLKDYAHIALKTPVRPDHVRIIHYFNVSNGYSCPFVIAIFPKQPKIHRLPRSNWHLALADIMEACKDGDIIEVFTSDMKELGEQAKDRIFPNKNIEFRVTEAIEILEN